jgi:hypothetical protein
MLGGWLDRFGGRNGWYLTWVAMVRVRDSATPVEIRVMKQWPRCGTFCSALLGGVAQLARAPA